MRIFLLLCAALSVVSALSLHEKRTSNDSNEDYGSDEDNDRQPFPEKIFPHGPFSYTPINKNIASETPESKVLAEIIGLWPSEKRLLLFPDRPFPDSKHRTATHVGSPDDMTKKQEGFISSATSPKDEGSAEKLFPDRPGSRKALASIPSDFVPNRIRAIPQLKGGDDYDDGYEDDSDESAVPILVQHGNRKNAASGQVLPFESKIWSVFPSLGRALPRLVDDSNENDDSDKILFPDQTSSETEAASRHEAQKLISSSRSSVLSEVDYENSEKLFPDSKVDNIDLNRQSLSKISVTGSPIGAIDRSNENDSASDYSGSSES